MATVGCAARPELCAQPSGARAHASIMPLTVGPHLPAVTRASVLMTTGELPERLRPLRGRLSARTTSISSHARWAAQGAVWDKGAHRRLAISRADASYSAQVRPGAEDHRPARLSDARHVLRRFSEGQLVRRGCEGAPQRARVRCGRRAWHERLAVRAEGVSRSSGQRGMAAKRSGARLRRRAAEWT